MTQTRDVLSQELAAQAIIDYFLTYTNEEEKAERLVRIDHLLEQVEKEYSGSDDQTWLGSFMRVFIFPWTRTRISELGDALAELRKRSDTVSRLAIIGGLLKGNGNYKSTSAHTLILDKLLVISKFNSLLTDTSLQEATKVDVRHRLKEALITKIDKIVSEYEDTHRQKRQQELAAVRPVSRLRMDSLAMKDIQAALNKHLKGEKITGEVTKARPVIDVKPIDKSLLAKRHSMLSILHTARPTKEKDTLVPLQMSGYHEAVVKAERGSLKDNSNFSSALVTMNSFFAEKLAEKFQQPKKVREGHSQAFAAIAKHFGA